MTRTRTLLLAPAMVLLHALAREADRGLGLVLRSEVEPDGLLAEVGRAMAADGLAVAGRLALWVAGGLAAWLALAAWRRRTDGMAWKDALHAEALVLAPLLLRPTMTLVALVSLEVRGTYPYGFTLPVALTQDWGIGQDAAALAAMLALRLPAPRLPAPRGAEVFLLSFLVYAVLVPDWAWRWEGHPGNEPKYLREGVALGLGLTFDAEGVSAAMEALEARPLAETVPAAIGAFGRESWRMAVALGRGEGGRDSIRATRVTRQTIRGKDGGVFYVLAPGPSLILAPGLRLDRAINLARGEPGRVAVSVLLWCALAALLVLALFLLVRDATGRPGLAAAIAFGMALVPPFLFYSFQFYPEMVGALVMAVAFRTLALAPEGLRRHPWRFGVLLATLPWLHQKFLPVWLVLVATALWVQLSFRGAPIRGGDAGSAVPADPSRPDIRKSLGVTVGLVVPTLVSLYLTALYNFAITGSVRPDALFLAWGPGGVTTRRVGQGLLGLLLDARYGILPYVPILMVAAGGLAKGGARRFAVVMPAAAVYYLTVASADNWAGAVCNLGRYIMPLAPLAVALVGIAIDRVTRRGALALVLILAAWTGLIALALRQDPHAANDSALLLAKSTYADGNQYIPNLFIRRWADGAPGLGARILVWVVAIGGLGAWMKRGSGASPRRTLSCLAALLLVFGFQLERAAPPTRAVPWWRSVLSAGPGMLVFLDGASNVREDEAGLGPGSVQLLLRAPSPVPGPLRITIGGQGGVVRVPGRPPIVLRPTGALLDLPLVPYHEVRGRDGRRVAFSRATLTLEGEAVLRVGEMEPRADGDR